MLKIKVSVHIHFHFGDFGRGDVVRGDVGRGDVVRMSLLLERMVLLILFRFPATLRKDEDRISYSV